MNTHLPPFPDSTHDQPVPVGLPIQRHWQDVAETKGFEITARVDDRYHLMLRCHSCGGAHRSKLHVLMTCQPLCPHCMDARWRKDAEAAGLIWLGRDPDDRHYGFYQAPCGHKLRRQFELVKRIAAGECAHRCERCQHEKEEAEARARGWSLIGPAPTKGPGYRRYRHACGHEQTIARANMQSGRFNCANCGEGWSTAPSFIYCMRFALPGLAPLVKLGFSRNPDSRLHWQLKRSPDLSGQILRSVPIRNGHTAQSLEKKMHAALRRDHRDSVIPPDQYRPWLRVKSEIYAAGLEPTILELLDELDTGSSDPD
ncbi:GIY-YIG nuclease family protein [Rhodovulum sulfidophilum]|uniref:GIY-YIG nuclease family protein n=1 Tax=Rhodovulum sulfidophilum TaxID=35806 RepID=UPI001EE3FC37|nr:GIY-YIG nuclease family protein [Rhodovulum sulfidophilum]